uniref:Uncharacterized protein n=1 Tax=Aegilops tauschii subsp. strangulata TaxID=200361 RepID=A0A453P0I9_AEGTS
DRQSQQQRRMPQLPKIEDDGNPRFVIFIRTANVYSSSIPSDLIVCMYINFLLVSQESHPCSPHAGVLLVPAQHRHRRHHRQDHARRQGQ